MADDTQPTLLDVTRAVADDVTRTIRGLGPQPLADLADEVGALADNLARRLSDTTPPTQRRLPVCKSGCDSCCRMHHVFVTPLEILRIARYVRETRSSAALAELSATIEEVAPRVATMTLKERAESRLPCVLLDETTGACSIHPARPLLCRGYNSTDVEVCRDAFARADNATPPPGDLQQATAHRHVFAGLVLSGEMLGLDAGPYELTNALRAALSSPDAETRWVAGEPVFAGAGTRISRDYESGWLSWAAGQLQHLSRER